jgi:hypothetical protein
VARETSDGGRTQRERGDGSGDHLGKGGSRGMGTGTDCKVIRLHQGLTFSVAIIPLPLCSPTEIDL